MIVPIIMFIGITVLYIALWAWDKYEKCRADAIRENARKGIHEKWNSKI